MRYYQPAIAILLAVVAPRASAGEPTQPPLLCEILGDATEHVGMTLTFEGHYVTDFTERSLVLADGCGFGIALVRMTPEAEKVLRTAVDESDPDREIGAIFTGTVVQREPSGMMYSHDTGVRLMVSKITNLKIVEPKSAP
ncbi:hypothetical protein [Sphingomonas sp. URHD0057]|uniref:hypothetical protein n=1 Tax=Sphingomonas sp. URHD0057 TaxID=1380389 RepID=UPI0012DF0F59|nr:hypothetical protein [Sphingomonas sp. URHD0057]